MNLLKIVPTVLLALGMIAVGCSDDDDPINNNNTPPNNNIPDDRVPTAISIDQEDLVVQINRPTPLSVTGTFEDGTMGFVVRGIEWSSSDEAVATVGVSGNVVGVATGTAMITAMINGLSDSIEVRVGQGGGTTSIALPMVVDDNFPDRSAFVDGDATFAETLDCPMRGVNGAVGNCHRITWDGTGGAFLGSFWTSGSDFIDLQGKRVEAGAGEVTFYAWGANGGEQIVFGAGLIDSNADGAEARATITLTTTPTQYSVPLTALAGYTDVFAPFIWAADNTLNPTGVDFFIDDIQWRQGDVTPPTGIPLPMVVDDNYPDRSAFGPDGPSLHTEDLMCPSRAGSEAGDCHRFSWDGTGGAFTGTFWTVGDSFMNLEGKRVEAGATEVSFYAWGQNGGEVITFGAGLIDANLDGAEDRLAITLTTTPTMYTVPLANLAGYTDVFGPFIWSADNTGNPNGFVFFVDDIQWKGGATQNEIPLPMVIDDNYPDRSGFGPNGPSLHTEDDACPSRAGSMAGNCHRFTWNGMGGAFTGTFWTIGEGFVDLQGRAVQSGAAEVSFYAWGASGGEVITFGAGIIDANRDGAEDRLSITLTTTPTRYTVPLSNLANYTTVFGPFIWSADNTANPSGFEFYVDDIQWVEGQMQAGLPIPMVVDDNYPGRSGFGPNGPPLHTEDDMCPSRAGDEAGACHRFIWNGMGGAFTGTFWTIGEGFVDLESRRIQAGAEEVSFYAWGAAGGEVITFGAGIVDANRDGAEDRLSITLTTTPTRYAVPLTNLANYTNVFGPFIWSTDNTANPNGFEFYVDDIKWQMVDQSDSGN